MSKLSPYKVQVVTTSVLTAVLLFSATAFAVTLPEKTHLSPAGLKINSQRALVKTKLQGVKLRSCQVREKGIKNRSIRLTNLAKNMQEKFDAIAQSVESYYTNTVIPSGKTVTSYGTLVADIQTKKTVVQTTLAKAQNDFTGFSCTLDNPKGVMTQFRQDMQSVKQALKDYRASIKKLIVAVHSVTGEENK